MTTFDLQRIVALDLQVGCDSNHVDSRKEDGLISGLPSSFLVCTTKGIKRRLAED